MSCRLISTFHSGLTATLVAVIVASTTVYAAESAKPTYEGMVVFNTTCTVCHWPGVGGAPRIGDKKAWEDRISKGEAALYENAIKGYQGGPNLMPARGGNWDLTDDQVKAAVDFILHYSK